MTMFCSCKYYQIWNTCYITRTTSVHRNSYSYQWYSMFCTVVSMVWHSTTQKKVLGSLCVLIVSSVIFFFGYLLGHHTSHFRRQWLWLWLNIFPACPDPRLRASLQSFLVMCSTWASQQRLYFRCRKCIVVFLSPRRFLCTDSTIPQINSGFLLDSFIEAVSEKSWSYKRCIYF